MVCHQGNDDIQSKDDNHRHWSQQSDIRFFTACLILFIGLCFCPTWAKADTYRIVLIQSDDNEFYQQFTSSLKNDLIKKCAELKSCRDEALEIDVVSYDEELAESDYDLIVTLGVKAHEQHLKTSANNSNRRYLHALIPLNLTHPSVLNHYSLVLDQKEQTIFTVLKKLITPDKPIGILYTENSRWRIEAIIKAAIEANVEIDTFQLESFTDSVNGAALSEILPKVSSIYMLPDKTLYNRVTINEILLTGFMNQTPFIGYSIAIAKTGALASIVNDREILLTDISSIVFEIINGNDVPEVNWPSTYKLIINSQIAKSLGNIINGSILNNPNVELIE